MEEEGEGSSTIDVLTSSGGKGEIQIVRTFIKPVSGEEDTSGNKNETSSLEKDPSGKYEINKPNESDADEDSDRNNQEGKDEYDEDYCGDEDDEHDEPYPDAMTMSFKDWVSSTDPPEGEQVFQATIFSAEDATEYYDSSLALLLNTTLNTTAETAEQTTLPTTPESPVGNGSI